MSTNPAYPETRHDVAQAVDLSDRAERERLSSDAVRAFFFNIMACWKIRDDDARRLLGSISNGTYYALKKGIFARAQRGQAAPDLLSRGHLQGLEYSLQ